MYNERHVGSQAIRFLPQLMELCVWVGGLTIVWMAAEIHHQCKCTFEVEEIEEENIMIIMMMMQNIFFLAFIVILSGFFDSAFNY